MKDIEQLSEASLKRKLKAIYALPQDKLTSEQLEMRNKMENRLWEIHREKHPPIITPPGFSDPFYGVEDW